ncbi:MAG: holo-ACP synthase [Anaeromyxobacteraceae bacterium]
MIVGLGLDLVEIARIRRILEGPPETAERFLARCFTPGERAYCETGDRAARLAARFAAKEAASKALGVPKGIGFLDVEVVPAEGGPPALRLDGVASRAAAALGVSRALLTLTHDGGVAAAVVVLEGR